MGERANQQETGFLMLRLSSKIVNTPPFDISGTSASLQPAYKFSFRLLIFGFFFMLTNATTSFECPLRSALSISARSLRFCFEREDLR